ncbi:D-alanine--D-alanine ligase family protein [Arsenicicoccus sp. oral taxon 190]|uniref:D-alanine--D-alanine ligase family protein n=1 Tax=Arsenicicoccus sp. oral taxon 190 TaxID=1658671 RepID=UPI00067A1027|nr:D-alanine--D-alanine ligase [Arsenicicoccus sp. oral taxon 190]AKT50859.1 D-alanine--D-alanine ligase [Arsenicicoccus sp. oral taxon 190]
MTTVLVLAGGLSHEREVSVRSGRRLAEALRSKGFDVHVADLDRTLLGTIDTLVPDLVWPTLHGSPGENGSLRDVLHHLGVPFVGPRGTGARLAWDKPVAKALVARAGLATPAHVAVAHSTFRQLGAGLVLERLAGDLGLPLAVKPARGGSALGFHVARTAAELGAALVDAYAYDELALVEHLVEGTEVSVTVLARPGGELEALPPVEICPVDGVFDYDHMYNAGETEYFTPARLSPEATRAALAAAVTAHEVLDHRHLSRTDLIVDAAGTPWFLECSVSPGLTETSQVPLALAGAGLDAAEVFAELAQAVIAEHHA